MARTGRRRSRGCRTRSTGSPSPGSGTMSPSWRRSRRASGSRPARCRPISSPKPSPAGSRRPPRAAELLAIMPVKAAADTSRQVLSPMPGLLTAVVVGEGQEVKAGEPLVVVEAMKMENVLRAERDGRVAKLRAKPGDSLAVDQVILEFE